MVGPMRIATWNVNGLRARQDFVLHWLRERRPDVVGLQELKLSDELFPHEVFEDLGAGDRLILGVSDNVPPDADLDRLTRISERVDAFGQVSAP